VCVRYLSVLGLKKSSEENSVLGGKSSKPGEWEDRGGLWSVVLGRYQLIVQLHAHELMKHQINMHAS
jgi:hypothetical protein